MLPQPVAERIKKLRDEVGEIRKADFLYLQKAASAGENRAESRHGWHNVVGEAEHERRLHRLLEIVDELKSLTDWKKP